MLVTHFGLEMARRNLAAAAVVALGRAWFAPAASGRTVWLSSSRHVRRSRRLPAMSAR